MEEISSLPELLRHAQEFILSLDPWTVLALVAYGRFRGSASTKDIVVPSAAKSKGSLNLLKLRVGRYSLSVRREGRE